MDAPTYNQELDAYLSSTGVVDATLYAKLAEAYAYDAASSVGWVEAKLRILAARVKRGDLVTLYEPTTQQATAATSEGAFVVWVKKHFPGARLDPRQPNNRWSGP